MTNAGGCELAFAINWFELLEAEIEELHFKSES